MKSLFLFANSKICHTLVVLSGLFFTPSVNAQEITPIVRAGIGFSDWRLSEVSGVKTGMLPALTLGVFAEVNLHESIFLESGLEYSHAGATLKFEEWYAPKYSMGYLNIPVLGKYRLDNGITFYAGPKAGFLLSANEKEEGEPKRDVKEAFKNADFSLAFGISYALQGGIDIGLHYTHGLVNVYNTGDDEIRNSGFAVKAGYIIPLPKA